MSFYDWYCDLPPASPMTWGEQTDVPESADWYNSGFLMLWGSNVPQTRTPDAHFYTEARYKGAKSVVVSPDYSEAAKFSDMWLHPKQGTDAALAMAFGHVILREFHLDRQAEYFENYCRQYTDMPLLVRLVEKDGQFIPDRQIRASEFKGALGEKNNPEWKTVAIDKKTRKVVVPHGSVGFRWGEEGKWNLEPKDGKGKEVELEMSLILDESHDEILPIAFPYFGNREHDHFEGTDHESVLVRSVPARRVKLADGDAYVATVFDLFVANYGLDRGLGDDTCAKSYDENVPYTPAWAEKITGVSKEHIITVAREFADNA
ncbi:molybdopterin-dependent oxidoreductase, partial [uncultured Kiloniella sp.]|uniref:molybdopterin-dependent oxidoreductase n=1 Tax=uncultured Kiloniella sp. TaxID=1133091 RepID=UPI002603AF3A